MMTVMLRQCVYCRWESAWQTPAFCTLLSTVGSSPSPPKHGWIYGRAHSLVCRPPTFLRLYTDATTTFDMIFLLLSLLVLPQFNLAQFFILAYLSVSLTYNEYAIQTVLQGHPGTTTTRVS